MLRRTPSLTPERSCDAARPRPFGGPRTLGLHPQGMSAVATGDGVPIGPPSQPRSDRGHIPAESVSGVGQGGMVIPSEAMDGADSWRPARIGLRFRCGRVPKTDPLAERPTGIGGRGARRVNEQTAPPRY